jgi:hypothetical protein
VKEDDAMTLPRRLAVVPVMFALVACGDPIGPTGPLDMPIFPVVDEFPPTTVEPAPPVADTLPRKPWDKRFDPPPIR